MGASIMLMERLCLLFEGCILAQKSVGMLEPQSHTGREVEIDAAA